jgi:hypothetical protein
MAVFQVGDNRSGESSGIFWFMVIGCGVVRSIVDGVMISTISICVWAVIEGGVHKSIISVSFTAVIRLASCSRTRKQINARVRCWYQLVHLAVAISLLDYKPWCLCPFYTERVLFDPYLWWQKTLLTSRKAVFNGCGVEGTDEASLAFAGRWNQFGKLLYSLLFICLVSPVSSYKAWSSAQNSSSSSNRSISSNVESRSGPAIKWNEMSNKNSQKIQGRGKSGLERITRQLINQTWQWIANVRIVKSRMRKKKSAMVSRLKEVFHVNLLSEKDIFIYSWWVP